MSFDQNIENAPTIKERFLLAYKEHPFDAVGLTGLVTIAVGSIIRVDEVVTGGAVVFVAAAAGAAIDQALKQ